MPKRTGEELSAVLRWGRVGASLDPDLTDQFRRIDLFLEAIALDQVLRDRAQLLVEDSPRTIECGAIAVAGLVKQLRDRAGVGAGFVVGSQQAQEVEKWLDLII